MLLYVYNMPLVVYNPTLCTVKSTNGCSYDGGGMKRLQSFSVFKK